MKIKKKTLQKANITNIDYRVKKKRKDKLWVVRKFNTSEWILNILMNVRFLNLYIYPEWVLKVLDNSVIYISTDKLEYIFADWIYDGNRIYHSSDEFIGGHDWSECLSPIEKLYAYKELEDLINHDWNYSNTNVYKAYIRQMKKGKPRRRQQILLDSEEKVNEYFIRFESLYLSIQRYGFLETKNLNSEVNNVDKEIGIGINDDGSFVKLPGGQHRIAIAKILNIAKIPVEVRMIHSNYLRKYKLYTITRIKEHIKNI